MDPSRTTADFDLIIPFVERLSAGPVPTDLPDDELAALIATRAAIALPAFEIDRPHQCFLYVYV